MKSHRIILLALVALTVACGQKKEESETSEQPVEEKAPVTLTKKWETEPLLTTCESVLYDEAKDILYVSNINNSPADKDNNGFVSTVTLDGKIATEKWATGMDAPKGMGLLNGKLFVADLDRVHEVDTETGAISHTYSVEGATFLNDIAVGDGKVFVSDSRGGAIYVIENGEVSNLISLEGPNGLFFEEGRLLVALWGEKTLNTLDLATKEVVKRVEGIENPDGIEAIGDNEYLVSSWNGIIHHVDSDWKRTVILDTRQDSVHSADIGYIKAKNLLLVPTFFKDKVVAYEVTK